MVQPSTASRIDLGLILPATTPAAGRLESAAKFNPLFTHRARITAAADIDDELCGWLATACAEHARGGPVQVEAGFENVHIVRIFDAGHHPIAACRRYDREIDSFVDVDPESPGIED